MLFWFYNKLGCEMVSYVAGQRARLVATPSIYTKTLFLLIIEPSFFRRYGCDVRLLESELFDHEEKCYFRQVECVCGENVKYGDFREHVVEFNCNGKIHYVPSGHLFAPRAGWQYVIEGAEEELLLVQYSEKEELSFLSLGEDSVSFCANIESLCATQTVCILSKTQPPDSTYKGPTYPDIYRMQVKEGGYGTVSETWKLEPEEKLKYDSDDEEEDSEDSEEDSKEEDSEEEDSEEEEDDEEDDEEDE